MLSENNDKIPVREDIDVITVKRIFAKVKSTLRFILSKWIVLLLGGIVGSALGLFVACNIKPTYTGTLNFVLSTGAKSSNILGLASQFGVDIGTSSGNDVFSGDNIISLFKSKKMIKSVLFKKPPNSNEILANIIVRDLEWDKAWKNNNRTRNLFPFPSKAEQLNAIQDSMIREVYHTILKKQLTISRADAKLSTYTLSTTSSNEVFACYLTRYLMDETANFYIHTKTSTAKQSLDLIQKEADSLKNLLSGSIVSTASEGDRTFALNPALQVQRARAQNGQVRTTVLATAYGEIVKNLELAKINLQKENPLYQIIDVPEMPLIVNKVSKVMALISGFAISVFTVVMYLLFARLIKSVDS